MLFQKPIIGIFLDVPRIKHPWHIMTPDVHANTLDAQHFTLFSLTASHTGIHEHPWTSIRMKKGMQEYYDCLLENPLGASKKKALAVSQPLACLRIPLWISA
jgi:hypothetical protein